MKIRRTQPPVGYRLPLADILHSVVDRSHGERRALEETVRVHFGVAAAFAVGSGKAALTAILRSLHARTGRTKVILPAYTCYSVPSAIVKAGLVPLPCDIGEDSFDYDYDALASLLRTDVLCALSVHLFGIPSDTRRLRELCEPRGIFVVEDSAQAMGVVHEGTPLGTRGDVAFFSLGRGKNLTCGSGGIILTKRPDIAATLAEVVGQYAVPGAADDARTLASLLAMRMFISPTLYWFPAGIPSLKLGETIFHDDFPLTRLSDRQARVIRNWVTELASLNRSRTLAGRFYRNRLAGVKMYGVDTPYLRFPILLEDQVVKERVSREGRTWGITRMYPGSVGGIPQIRSLLSCHTFPRAERVASSLVTLPTHPLMTDGDRSTVCAIVNGQPRMR